MCICSLLNMLSSETSVLNSKMSVLCSEKLRRISSQFRCARCTLTWARTAPSSHNISGPNGALGVHMSKVLSLLRSTQTYRRRLTVSGISYGHGVVVRVDVRVVERACRARRAARQTRIAQSRSQLNSHLGLVGVRLSVSPRLALVRQTRNDPCRQTAVQMQLRVERVSVGGKYARHVEGVRALQLIVRLGKQRVSEICTRRVCTCSLH